MSTRPIGRVNWTIHSSGWNSTRPIKITYSIRGCGCQLTYDKPNLLAPQNLLHSSNQTYHEVNIEPDISYNKQCELMKLLYSDFSVITISFHD